MVLWSSWKNCECISIPVSWIWPLISHLSCDYLPQRYPTLYRKTDVGLDNLATGETFNIVRRPLPEDPMAMSARLVQDDLAIMFEKADGQYYLLAGAILLAGFWSVACLCQPATTLLLI